MKTTSNNTNLANLSIEEVQIFKNELAEAIRNGEDPKNPLFYQVAERLDRPECIAGRRTYEGNAIERIVHVYLDFYDGRYYPFLKGESRAAKFIELAV